MRLKSTIDQWLTLIEIDNAGSIQAAALRLNKSHTTLMYAVRKLEAQMGVNLLYIEGRKSVLTEHAQTLLRRAKPMIEQARELEVISKQLSQGVEAEIIITIDHLCCRSWLYQPLQQFLSVNSATSIQIRETSLTSTKNAVIEKSADIALVNIPVANHLAEAFGIVNMVPIVARTHELASKPKVCNDDLLVETQIVVRDLGADNSNEEENAGWLKAQRRITVDSFDHAINAVLSGLGFCRVPEHMLEKLDNKVTALEIQGGSRFQIPVHLVAPKEASTGIAAKQLYEILLADARKRLASAD